MNPTGTYLGYKFILTDRRSVLKYPSGKKDGNKLGKRKRNSTILLPTYSDQKDSEVLVDKERMTILCTSKQYEAILAKTKQERVK